MLSGQPTGPKRMIWASGSYSSAAINIYNHLCILGASKNDPNMTLKTNYCVHCETLIKIKPPDHRRAVSPILYHFMVIYKCCVSPTCMDVCIYEWMDVSWCIYKRMYVWIYVCIYVCMYACMHVCMYAYVCTHVRMYACTYVHMYVFMNV